MDELDRRTEALVSAPLGYAFVLEVERVGWSPDLATDPVRSFHVLGRAVTEVSVWRGEQAAVVQELLDHGLSPRPLVRAILARPEAAWWFGPLDRRAARHRLPPRAGLSGRPTD